MLEKGCETCSEIFSVRQLLAFLHVSAATLGPQQSLYFFVILIHSSLLDSKCLRTKVSCVCLSVLVPRLFNQQQNPDLFTPERQWLSCLASRWVLRGEGWQCEHGMRESYRHVTEASKWPSPTPLTCSLGRRVCRLP